MKQQSGLSMNRAQAEKLDLANADQVQIRQGEGTAVLPLLLSDDIPAGCVGTPGGIDSVKYLSDAYGVVELEIVS